MKKRITALLVCALFLGVFAFTHAQISFPQSEESGSWQKNNNPDWLISQGIHPARLEAFGRWNVENNWNGQSLMSKSCIVIKDGIIIGEWYADQNGQPLTPEEGNAQMARLSSNGKALAMLLFGRLVEERGQGNIPADLSIDSKLYDSRWLPEGFPLSDNRKEQITFDMVFGHRSGLLPESLGNDRGEERSRIAFTVGHESKHPASRRLFFTPDKPQSIEPNSPYSNVAFNHLSMVFRNLAGEPEWKFLEKSLLNPMGISNVAYSVDTDNRLQPWHEDGVRWICSGGIMLAPRDYARIGLLLLNNGNWNGRQLVPSDWIGRFTSSSEYPDLSGNVSGFWNADKSKGPGFSTIYPQYPQDMFSISGSGLTNTYVIPSKGIVVLRTSRIFSVDEQDIQRQFLDRLFSCFEDFGSFSIQTGVTMDGQLIPDPMMPSWLVHNNDGDSNDYPDPAFYCSTGNWDGFLYGGRMHEDGTRSGDQIEMIRDAKTWEGLSARVVAIKNGATQDANNLLPGTLQVPWENDKQGMQLNQSLLEQWDDWLTELDNNGIIIQFYFYDDPEHAKVLFAGANTDDPVLPEETRFINEIISRLDHHKNIIWGIGISNQKSDRIQAIAEVIRNSDKHNHLITVPEASIQDIHLDSRIYPLQFAITRNHDTSPDEIYKAVRQTLQSTSERNPVHISIAAPDLSPDMSLTRKQMWAAVMAGASGITIETGNKEHSSKIQGDCQNLTNFIRSTYYIRTEPRDELCFKGTKHILASTGRCYIAYTDQQTGSLGIKGMPAGMYEMFWYDIQNNQFERGKIEVQQSQDYIWKIPAGYGNEVALYLVRNEYAPDARKIPRFVQQQIEVESRFNVPPQAKSRKAYIVKGKSGSIQLFYDDPDGGPGPYTITILQSPKKGILSGNGNDLVYTPNAKSKGKDVLTWMVNDGTTDSNSATIEIVIGNN